MTLSLASARPVCYILSSLVDSVTDLERERVAEERRHWVRINRACNNHCIFCLDSDIQDGTMIRASEVQEEILAGLEQGATRLILSGGEASIHPDFISLIRFGKQAGYRHVQTISNGRMFAYRRFVHHALQAGLDEVTFSMHGHTPELHDMLTGVGGSFLQTVAGIRNVVSTRRCIVSGDVVVNRHNVEHLRSILDLFLDLGVREFDVLMVVPFGRASPDEGADVLFDPTRTLRSIRSALELGKDPSIHLWTNRMDPMLLEGFEHLIQDPYKLRDEVRGRRDILQGLVAGRRMRCAGDRCSHCFIRQLCSSMRRDVRRLARNVPGTLHVDVSDGPPRDALADLMARKREVLWLRARNASQVMGLSGCEEASRLWLELDDPEGARGVQRLILWKGDQLEPALRASPEEILVLVNRSTAGFLEDLLKERTTRILLGHRGTLTLREAAETEVEDLRGLLSDLEPDGTVGLAPCLGAGMQTRWEDPLDASVLDRRGLVDPGAYVDHFIRYHYRVRSLRCRQCVHEASCPGIPVNLVRLRGLSLLEPIR